jgi:hypothetical protein
MLEEATEREELSSTGDRRDGAGDVERRPRGQGISLGELKAEISSLKGDKSWGKSAIISFGKDSRQVFFDEANAIPMLTKRIKELWGIPRKIYWLSVNGKHESTVSTWPQTSSVVIQIRGLAGEGGYTEDSSWEADDMIDPSE